MRISISSLVLVLLGTLATSPIYATLFEAAEQGDVVSLHRHLQNFHSLSELNGAYWRAAMNGQVASMRMLVENGARDHTAAASMAALNRQMTSFAWVEEQTDLVDYANAFRHAARYISSLRGDQLDAAIRFINYVMDRAIDEGVDLTDSLYQEYPIFIRTVPILNSFESFDMRAREDTTTYQARHAASHRLRIALFERYLGLLERRLINSSPQERTTITATLSLAARRAAEIGRLDVIERLRRAGADNIQGILYGASYEGHEHIVAWALNLGASINVHDPYSGMTPFQASIASPRSQDDIVDLLMNGGAMLTSTTASRQGAPQRTILELADSTRNFEVRDLIYTAMARSIIIGACLHYLFKSDASR